MRMKQILVAAALIGSVSYGLLPQNSMANSLKIREENVNVVSGGILRGSAKIAVVDGTDYVASSSAVKILGHLPDARASFAKGILMVVSQKASTNLPWRTRGIDRVKINGDVTLRFDSLALDGTTFIPLDAVQMTLAELGALSGLQGTVLSIFPGLPSSAVHSFVSKIGIANVADARSFERAPGRSVEIIPYFQQNGVLHIAAYSAERLQDFSTNETAYSFMLPIDWQGRHGIWIGGSTGTLQSDMTLLDITGQNATQIATFKGSYSVSYFLMNGSMVVVTSDRAAKLTLPSGRVDTVLSNRLYDVVENQATEQTHFKSGEPFSIGSSAVDPAWQAFSIVSEMIQFGNPAAMKKDLASKFNTARDFYRIARTQVAQLTSFLHYQFPVLSLELASSGLDYRTYSIVGGHQRLELTLEKANSTANSTWSLSGLSLS